MSKAPGVTIEQVYDFIRQYVETHGIAPSRGEIADRFNIRISTVQTFLLLLETRGKIRRVPGEPRVTVITKH
jgi:SOS-response transcriptional repressor LexA